MTWGLTYSAYPKLKIVHQAGRVHSNVDPLSRLRRRIPFFEQPASNDPDIDLSQEKDIDFYGRMKREFDTRASSLFSHMEEPLVVQIDIPLPSDHPLESLSYHTTTQVETHIHIDPKEIQEILKGYDKDTYFKNIIQFFPKEAPFFYKNYHRNTDGLIFFEDSSGRDRLCIPSSMKQSIMEEVHESMSGSAHGGFEQTYGKIANRFFWPKMVQDI